MYKRSVLESGYWKKVGALEKKYRLNGWLVANSRELLIDKGVVVDVGECLSKMEDAKNEIDIEKWGTMKSYQASLLINESRRKRIQRCRQRIINMFASENEVVFVTLTFRDEIFEKTSKETRRRYVARFLKENCERYCANVDFGSKNEREHYHGVIVLKSGLKASKMKNKWLYGFDFYEKVGNEEKDKTKTSKYINKLTNHSLKDSGQFERLIYSRLN